MLQNQTGRLVTGCRLTGDCACSIACGRTPSPSEHSTAREKLGSERESTRAVDEQQRSRGARAGARLQSNVKSDGIE
eukprot:6201402-Pleurochrysis_carterae.AAC.3